MADQPQDAFAADLLNRRPFAERFERYLLTEHEFVDAALVVSLHAPFGSGKSTFLSMWADDLRQRREKDDRVPRVVVINAWETDHCGDPLVAILAGLKDVLERGPKPNPEEASKVVEAAKDAGWFLTGVANSVAAHLTGADAIAAAEYSQGKKDARVASRVPVYDAILLFEKRCAALAKLKEQLRDSLGGDQVNAVVVVDEIDRCRPDYAISYLETIKHIFNVHGMVFVLGIDERQIRSATSVLFGDGISFREYFRKFSHRTISLPPPVGEDTVKLIANYVARFLSKDRVRITRLKLGGGMEKAIGQLFHDFGLTPRQSQEALRVAGHALGGTRGEPTAHWGYASAILFLSVLRIADEELYAQFAQGGRGLPTLVSAMQRVKHHRARWYGVLVAGVVVGDSDWKSLFSEGLNKLSLGAVSANEYAHSWGDSPSRDLTTVHQRIESIVEFENAHDEEFE